MVKVLLIDSTKEKIYTATVCKYVNEKNVTNVNTLQKAMSYIQSNVYDIIVITEGVNCKYDYLDLADVIKFSRLNKHCIMILLEDRPTKVTKFIMYLRGRQIYTFNSNQLDKLEEILERISK